MTTTLNPLLKYRSPNGFLFDEISSREEPYIGMKWVSITGKKCIYKSNP